MLLDKKAERGMFSLWRYTSTIYLNIRNPRVNWFSFISSKKVNTEMLSIAYSPEHP